MCLKKRHVGFPNRAGDFNSTSGHGSHKENLITKNLTFKTAKRPLTYSAFEYCLHLPKLTNFVVQSATNTMMSKRHFQVVYNLTFALSKG